MSATAKHEFHPDAESLSAFAQQALSHQERGQVLEHLAACGRCRQVIALAREAADAEAATTKPERRAAVQPDLWWKRWRLVWVPTAVVAAFTAASISVYVHQADRSGASNNIAEQTTTQNEPVAANSAPPKNTPPVPHAAAKAPAATEKPKLPAVPPNSSSQQVTVTAAAPPQLQAPEQVELVPPETASASGVGGNGFYRRTFAPAAAPSVSAAQPAVRAFREEQKRRDEQSHQEAQLQARTGENRALPPPSPETPNLAPPTAPTTNGGPPENQNADAFSSDRPIQVRSGSIASFGSMKSSHGMAKAAVETAIILPSGLPAVSSAAIGRRMLAIDKAGALFLSVDAGNHWQLVLRQWTGRAVTVRRSPDANAAASSATEQPELALAVTVPAPAPPAFFEILNDKDQVWLSTDGQLWSAK